MNEGMKVPIIPVLEHYGAANLPDTERWRSVRCPFHEDRNASASYIAGENGQAFNCFTCSAKGDAIALVKQQEGLEFKDAVQRCEEIVGQSLSLANAPAPKRYKPVRIGDTGPQPVVAAPRRRKKLRLRED